MAYKKLEFGFSFADMAIQAFAEKNRSLLFLLESENAINWNPIQKLLMKYYPVGKAK